MHIRYFLDEHGDVIDLCNNDIVAFKARQFRFFSKEQQELAIKTLNNYDNLVGLMPLLEDVERLRAEGKPVPTKWLKDKVQSVFEQIKGEQL